MADQTENQEGKSTIDLAAIQAKLASGEGAQVWRSLGELAGTAEFQEFLHQEFPRETGWVNSLSRRGFLKLLAAPLALAGLSACLPQPQERILPYAAQAPERIIPGRPLYFATAMEMDGYAQGLLVESHMGRPTKVEGNPLHPASLGATDTFAQASILGLYDPDRAQVVSSRGQIRTWDAFLEVFSRALDAQRGEQGAGLRLLSGTITSPTLAAQARALFEQFPQAIWYQYDPAGHDYVRSGAQMAFGEVVQTRYRLDRANVILSLDNNFAVQEPGSLRYLREFAARRQVSGQEGNQTGGQIGISRLYMIESTMTSLGAFADHRLPVQAAQVEILARLLAERLGVQVGGGTQPASEEHQRWIEAAAGDLQANQGQSLVLAGPQQPPVVHALVHAINAALGNAGQTVFYTDPVEAFPVDQTLGLSELADDLAADRVDLLVILGGNPVYTSPADLDFAGKLPRAGLSVYLGLYDDETAGLAHWHIPSTHYLEMWSDTRAFDGTATIVQPLIEPLYGGRSAHELLAVILGQPNTSGYDIVRGFWREQMQGSAAGTGGVQPPVSGQAQATPGAQVSPTQAPAPGSTPGSSGQSGASTPAPAGQTQAGTQTPAGGESEAGQAGTQGGAQEGAAEAAFERFWNQALRDGVIANTTFSERPAAAVQADFSAPPAQPDPESLEIVFTPDPSIWDGRFANNAWLQELPKPITKLTWDNAALVSPATALRLGLSNEELVELRYRERSVRAPVLIVPGQPDNSITVHLGYGRSRGGQVLAGTGFNAYTLRTSDAPWFGYGLEILRTGGRYRLAQTQEHFSMEGRELARAGTLEEYQQNPDFVQEAEHGTGTGSDEGPPPSLYPEYEYESYAWGMAINLSSCIGCNACVVACQAENNVPVVGKDQVEDGREMHWLRIDTYFEGGLENPEALFQPMLCQHCEKAPCEPVCPVEATVHSSEGLNEMVYNRCVGTRYCSNNCPYKVRRFNFYEYADLQYGEENRLPLRMLHNPDVTVRSRGVMEKCTYCVQRINYARVDAKTQGRRIQDGEVMTACQQACPTRAIVFGDINDPNSQVSRLKEQPLNYGVLAELGTQPRTSYLAKIRNPNPELGE